jgi:hypothetical protein
MRPGEARTRQGREAGEVHQCMLWAPAALQAQASGAAALPAALQHRTHLLNEGWVVLQG